MTIRKIIGFPVHTIGVLCFLLYELIAGDKVTFRHRDVVEAYKEGVTATCSNCGHRGKIKDVA